jgi:hypothetical protein
MLGGVERLPRGQEGLARKRGFHPGAVAVGEESEYGSPVLRTPSTAWVGHGAVREWAEDGGSGAAWWWGSPPLGRRGVGAASSPLEAV